MGKKTDRQLLLDKFANEYTFIQDNFAPPERYIYIYAEIDDIIIEKWTNGKEYLSIAFAADTYRTSEAVKLRNYMLKENNFTSGVYLHSYSCPGSEYEKLYELAVKNDEFTEEAEDE